MLTKMTATLLTIFCTTQAVADDSTPLPSENPYRTECPATEICECYTQSETAKLAKAFRQCKVWQAQLADANRFIKENADKQQAAHLQWWQEPAVVGGGIVLSFSLGAIVMYAVIR